MMTLKLMAERKRDLERRIERLAFLVEHDGELCVTVSGRVVELAGSKLAPALAQELADNKAELEKITHALAVAAQVANGLMNGE